ncbi:MAG: hypothetical protein ACRD35_00065 [Candidatus Acidiferrales bacterium]
METYLTIFIAVTAAAVVLQAGILVALYLRLAKFDEETRALRRQLSERADPILRNVEDITLTVRDRGRVIAEDLSAMSYDARRQVEKFDRLTDELADRLRLQILRIDLLLTQALESLEKAGTTVKETVVQPMQEAAALMKGVKAALEFLASRPERAKKGARADEELFI